jgi:hypothetical protein
MTTVEAEGTYIARTIERGSLAGGLVEFEERPPKTPGGKGYRAYHFTPVGEDSKRVRLKSVTTVLGEVVPKFSLQAWYEEAGAEGAAILAAQGRLDGVDPARAIDHVRDAGLGAGARMGSAQHRGLSVHALLEEYAKTGAAPNPADHPEAHRGYIRGLVRWLVEADPEPIAVERLVVEPTLGYAGRMDLRARVHGRDVLVDLKTNRRGVGYLEAHIQAAGYALAESTCGDGYPDGCLIVAVGERGEMEAVDGVVTWRAWESLIRWHRTLSKAKADYAELRKANR